MTDFPLAPLKSPQVAVVLKAGRITVRKLHITARSLAESHNVGLVHICVMRRTTSLLHDRMITRRVETVLSLAVVDPSSAGGQLGLCLALLPLAHYTLDGCVVVEKVAVAIGFLAKEASDGSFLLTCPPVLEGVDGTISVHFVGIYDSGKATLNKRWTVNGKFPWFIVTLFVCFGVTLITGKAVDCGKTKIRNIHSIGHPGSQEHLTPTCYQWE